MEMSEKFSLFEEVVGYLVGSWILRIELRGDFSISRTGFRAICTVIHVEEYLIILKWKSVIKH